MALGNIEHMDVVDTLKSALLDRMGKEREELEASDKLRHEVR